MADRQLKLTQAEIRLELRDLEVQIQKLRHEQQFYKRMGFARDIQDMQMVELLDRRRELEARMRHFQLRTRQVSRGQVGVLSWMMLLPMLVVMAFQSRLGRTVQASS